MKRLVICTTVELMVVMAVNSASLQSADVIAAHQRHQQPCTAGSGKTCPSHISGQATSSPASTTGLHALRRQINSTAGNESVSDRHDQTRQKRRDQHKSQPPQQNITVQDNSVAEALALAADVGRGPPARPVPPRPPTAQPAMPNSAVKLAASKGSSSSKGPGGKDAINAMLTVGCESEPCQHGGVCYTDAFSPRGFSCRCATGYYGDVCEYGQ